MDAQSSKRIELDSVLQDERLNLNLHSLSLKDLREITNDFSDENLLGQGGFGTVYKGLLPNGNIIAVKKLITSTKPGLQDKQYENEVRHLMRLIHPNIVQLVGYCSETEKYPILHNGKYVYAEKSERLLFLEYMPKGSLRNHISDASSGLDWQTRYKIILGICHGLHYLHEEWQHSTPIIHRDLKPANILLDDNMVPKIADFGLSRLFGEEQTRTTTKNFDGTLGYMAPEYLNRGIITKELDIFSLGVIIIQVVTGKKHYPYNDDETSSQKFAEDVVKEWRNRPENLPGYTCQEFGFQQIRRCIDIGLLCVKYDRAQRPTTSRIIEMLASKDAESSNKREEQLEHVMVIDKFSEQLLRKRPGFSKVKEPSSTQSSRRNAGKMLPKKMTRPVRVSCGDDQVDDGSSWRKYGQNYIKGAKHPRAYYRCAHRRSRGCLATKKVQRTDDDPTIFDVIYHGVHTCVQWPAGVAAATSPELQEVLSRKEQLSELLEQLRAAPYNDQTGIFLLKDEDRV